MSAVTESIVSDEIMEAIFDWVVAGSGLAESQVVWQDERGETPSGCYISMAIDAPREVGRDFTRVVTPDSLTFTADDGAFTAADHGYVTGAGPFQCSSTLTLPTGLVVGTDYWLIRLTDDTFALASSEVNALAETPVAITGDGTGVLTLVPYWIEYRVEGARTLELHLQCFAGNEPWRDARPVARLANVIASRTLPSRAAALRAAGVGVGPVGPVQPLRTNSPLFESRAVCTVDLHLVSRQSENGTWIQRVLVAPTLDGVMQDELDIDR